MSAQAEVDSYQVEILKAGEPEIVELLVSTVRGARGRRKLLGEAHVWDFRNPIIQFRVLHAKDLNDLQARFITQLIHRGYRPLRVRARAEGKVHEWVDIDQEAANMAELEAANAPVDVTE